MSNLQKIGSIAAIGLGVLFVCYMGLLLVILPTQGYGPHTLNDPANGISFLATSGLPVLIDFIYMGMAVAFLLIALALYERFGAVAPSVMPISLAAGLMASVLFLGYAMINFVGGSVAVNTHQHDALLGSALYLALRAVTNGLNAAALFAAGWSILLAGWAAHESGQLATSLSKLLIAAGATLISSFVLLPIGLFGVLLGPVWSIWLGIALSDAHAQRANI